MSLRSAIIAILSLCAVGATAQEKSSPDPPAPYLPSANPARPTVTNPATLPPVGYLQFENGYLGSLASPETDAQFGANQVTKLAFHPRIMVQAQFQPYAASRDTGDSPFTHGFGDILIGPQVVLFSPGPANSAASSTQADKKTPVPTIALGYLGRVHSGTTEDIDLGGPAHSIILLFSGDIGGFHYDTNYLLNIQTSNDTGATLRHVQAGQTISVNHALFTKDLQLSVELYHFSQPFVHTTSHQQFIDRANLVDLLVAPTYQLHPNLVFDIGFTRGLTSTSTRWQSIAGFTYLLPHRLWPSL